MESITLTEKELLRLQVAQRLVAGALQYAQAAAELGLSRRQTMRFVKRLRSHGPQAFVSRKRGRRSNHRLADHVREQIVGLAKSEYRDFGPTLLAEKLAERNSIVVSRETLRQLLITENLHKPRRRRPKPRPMRERRPQFGQLVQVDGSPHPWFEDRGPRCTLLLAIDDATGAVLAGRFEHVETTDGYFAMLRTYFTDVGRPQAIYTDKHSIFRTCHGTKTNHETHVQRALMELDIQLICANSPQAKGRVERANRTLQDRLLKELRLQNISCMQEANAFLPTFIAQYNRRFSKPAAESGNAHRTCEGIDLDCVLVRRYTRKLTKDLTFQLGDVIYAIDPDPSHALRGGMYLWLLQHRDAGMQAWHKGTRLPVRCLGKRQRNAPIVSSKSLDTVLEQKPKPRGRWTPPLTHPWRMQTARACENKLRRLNRTQG